MEPSKALQTCVSSVICTWYNPYEESRRCHWIWPQHDMQTNHITSELRSANLQIPQVHCLDVVLVTTGISFCKVPAWESRDAPRIEEVG